ncbi:SGNH/GDSL hydrolase family protein [Streptomyces sp. V4I23]|uniref:SGNH/GDSL hydrolase family protein n=1 Tax=Streptomyces sp. V4I23 TaxID=3042282 RepID=UPI0027D7753E|nr:SGNH/GDSL hydrolase family protein [Streptomyces sp. V4I23]
MDQRTPLENVKDCDRPLTWAFIGDSVTAGTWHTYGARSYPELFTERMRELARTADVFVNTAVSGWTAQDLDRHLDRIALRFSPDVVVVGIGLNDTRHGTAGLADFASTYRRLVRAVREETGATVVVQTPNDTLPTAPQHVVDHLPRYAEQIRAVAEDTGAPLVDHYAVWTDPASPAPEHWYAMGCHPGPHGHRAMARTLLDAFGAWDPASRTGRLTIP